MEEMCYWVIKNTAWSSDHLQPYLWFSSSSLCSCWFPSFFSLFASSDDLAVTASLLFCASNCDLCAFTWSSSCVFSSTRFIYRQICYGTKGLSYQTIRDWIEMFHLEIWKIHVPRNQTFYNNEPWVKNIFQFSLINPVSFWFISSNFNPSWRPKWKH